MINRLKLMVGVFKCRTCGHESIEQTGELMVAPTSCPNGCDCTKKGFILDPDKSTFEETPYCQNVPERTERKS